MVTSSSTARIRCSLLPLPPPPRLVQVTCEKQDSPGVDRETRTPPLAICMVNEGVERLSREPGAQLLPPETQAHYRVEAATLDSHKRASQALSYPYSVAEITSPSTWSPRIGNRAVTTAAALGNLRRVP